MVGDRCACGDGDAFTSPSSGSSSNVSFDDIDAVTVLGVSFDDTIAVGAGLGCDRLSFDEAGFLSWSRSFTDTLSLVFVVVMLPWLVLDVWQCCQHRLQ